MDRCSDRVSHEPPPLYQLTRPRRYLFPFLRSCAKWLNGLGKGARYDGSLPGYGYHGSCNGKTAGTVSDLSNSDKYNLRQFIEAQLDAYEKRTGWIFWTWKTESAPEWDMQDLLANGLFPQPLTARQYPNQCGFWVEMSGPVTNFWMTIYPYLYMELKSNDE